MSNIEHTPPLRTFVVFLVLTLVPFMRICGYTERVLEKMLEVWFERDV
jgi:hypothetical protein